ncbi:hypothetical protein OG339_16865 [Streptosporangium sp. NBC_01495]|nr:hypothetical protein [Streptosporangium sp. NBC_01495]
MSGWSPGRLSLAGSEPDLFDNPASGSQGSILRDGEIVGWDLHPGGTPWEDDGPLEVFFSCLYRYNAVAYSCAYAGLRMIDTRAVIGPPDV